jgi:hypothetical protein
MRIGQSQKVAALPRISIGRTTTIKKTEKIIGCVINLDCVLENNSSEKWGNLRQMSIQLSDRLQDCTGSPSKPEFLFDEIPVRLFCGLTLPLTTDISTGRPADARRQMQECFAAGELVPVIRLIGAEDPAYGLVFSRSAAREPAEHRCTQESADRQSSTERPLEPRAAAKKWRRSVSRVPRWPAIESVHLPEFLDHWTPHLGGSISPVPFLSSQLYGSVTVQAMGECDVLKLKECGKLYHSA